MLKVATVGVLLKTVHLLEAQSGIAVHRVEEFADADDIVHWVTDCGVSALVVRFAELKRPVMFVKTLRNHGCTMPIIACEPAGFDDDHHAAFLNAGGDYFVNETSSIEVLVAAIHVCVRRPLYQPFVSKRSYVYKDSIIVIDPTQFRVTVNDRDCLLTGNEYRLLYALAMRDGATEPIAALYDAVYSTGEWPESNVAQTVIARIRKKMSQIAPCTADFIVTIRGAGYRLNFEPATRKCDRL